MPSRPLLRSAGLVLGVALVGVLATGWRVPTAPPLRSAEVTLRAAPVPLLAVDPAGAALLTARPLRRGVWHVGSPLRVTSIAGAPGPLRLRVAGGDPALDGAVRLRLLGGLEPLFDGPLAALRAGRDLPRALRPGEELRLQAAVGLEGAGAPATASSDVTLIFDVGASAP